jgi:hypothetical protein
VHPLKNFPAFYGAQGSLPCSQEPSTGLYPESDQSIPYHPICLRSILTLSTHLRLGLPSGLFSSGFPKNILCAVLFSPSRVTCPAHLIFFDLKCLVEGSNMSCILFGEPTQDSVFVSLQVACCEWQFLHHGRDNSGSSVNTVISFVISVKISTLYSGNARRD